VSRSSQDRRRDRPLCKPVVPWSGKWVDPVYKTGPAGYDLWIKALAEEKADATVEDMIDICDKIGLWKEPASILFYSKLFDTKNNKIINQVNNIVSIMEEKLGEDFIEDFSKAYIDVKSVEEKFENYYATINTMKKSQKMSNTFNELSKSLTNIILSSPLISNDNNDLLAEYLISFLVFVVCCLFYVIGLPIAIALSIATAIIYISLIAKALFQYNTPAIAIFFTISFFILACIVALAYAFTWPIWIAAVVFQCLISDNLDSTQLNNLLKITTSQ
jgi:hypothetical protein